MSYKDPKTYWEKRCNLNEQLLRHLITALFIEANPSMLNMLNDITQGYQDSVDALNKEVG
jgi:hypothetical protein